ncbi:MAG TPA: SdiA-regulated domain-containing protein [Hanamia sp.]|nr:SdiA-regulated domain-containing protein [Hanamia sp.]
MKVFLLSFSFLVFSFYSCKPNNGSKNNSPVIVKLPPKTSSVSSTKAASSVFNYDLKAPDRTWKLPPQLVEVSGNAWLDKDHFILIEDTHPNLYLIRIDDKNATLEKTISFQKDEKDKFDIEDVCMVGEKVYALWSHGVLFEINNWNSNADVKEINTGLSKKNNTEGLCYDPVTKKLLIACKDESGIEGEKKSAKAVYQFDIETQKLDEKPFLVIHKADFEKLAGSKLAFNPSAIAVHPVTHEIYLLSTRDNKCMAVFNREGALLSFQFIDKDLMPQPEGICFSPEGKLYISSEGKKGEPGNLFEFNSK